MSRLKLLHPDDMTPEQLDYYKKIRERSTFKAEPENKPLVGPFGAYQLSIPYARLKKAMSDHLRFEGLLPSRLVELATIIAARLWMTDFAYCSHERGALREGINEDVVGAIRNGTTPDFDKADEEAVYNYLTKLFAQKCVDDATYKAVVEQLGEAALVELIGLAGHYVTTCMTLNTFEIPAREGDIPIPRV
jgi:4-carboxymuconolactone decarboxylase